MKAVILAGGQGTRLRPLTENLPKPMITLFGRPIMEYIVRHLTRFDVHEIVATLHYRPRAIRDHFGEGSDLDVAMHYTLEKEPLGTAGSVKLGEELLDETFLVVGGDALVDFDFGEFLKFHRRKKAKVSLCLIRVRDPGEFGIVITDDDGRVQRFLEKPGPSEVFSDTVNTGIYLIEPDILQQIPEHTQYDFAGDLFPKLMELDVPIYGYVARGYWSDIGTLEQLKQAHWDFLDGKVSLPFDGNLVSEGVWTGQDCDISPEADIKPPCWLGNNVHVRGGAKIGPYAMVGDNVEIDQHAMLARTIVMQNSFIGEGADLRNSIVAARNIIEAECELGSDVVIGAGSHLGRHVVVKPGVMVWPDKVVDTGATLVENLVWESMTRPSIFGSRGISGLGNLHITPEFTAVIGKAFGTWIKAGGKVVVSRDSHPFSRLIKRALVSGLLAVGVDVDDLEESTTPVTRFTAGYGRNTSGGVHIRISELHPEVAHIELFDERGLPLSRDARRKVEATFHRADFPKVAMASVGLLRYPGRVSKRYRKLLFETLHDNALAGFDRQIVYSAGDGVTARIMDELLTGAGVQSMRIATAEGSSAQIEKLRKIARLNTALGLLIAINSEDIHLIDESGDVLPPSRTRQLLIASFIIGAPKELPVFLAANHPQSLYRLAEEHGRKVIVTRVEPASRLAEATGQASGQSEWIEFVHYYLGFDAIAASINLLAFLAKHSMTLQEFQRRIPQSFDAQLTIPCPWNDMGRVMRTLAELKEADIDASPEGIRLIFENGIIFVLPGSDHPELLVAVEADDISELAKLVGHSRQMLHLLIRH